MATFFPIILHWAHTWQNVQALFREDFLEGGWKGNCSFNHQAIALRKWNHHIFFFFFFASVFKCDVYKM